MKLKNISKRKFMHLADGWVHTLNKGEVKEIPDAIAEIWLKSGEVVKVDDGAKDDEIAKLKAELEALKAEKADSAENAQTETAETSEDDEKAKLLAQAKELGLKVSNLCKVETIKAKIAEALEVQSAE